MDEFMGGLVNIALFVVDKLIVYSDWGHDFRPDFVEQYKFVNNLPEIHLYGDTATAITEYLEILRSMGQKLEIQEEQWIDQVLM